MKTKETNQNPNKEIGAISAVHQALKDLDQPAQKRVMDYVASMLNLGTSVIGTPSKTESEKNDEPSTTEPARPNDESLHDATDEGLDGISPVAQKWMRRNGLNANQLSSIFSLGVDEIDLVAKAVPEKSKRARMYNVVLLKGAASYLSSGVARFTHEQARETCVHYDAYDRTNFANYFKSFAADVSGSKESGYTLTARGLTNATELIKRMAEEKKVN
jgi:hypothetical protein